MKRLVWLVLLAACGGDDNVDHGSPPTLRTTPKQWEYVPVDGTKCMNGTPTGIGVNLGTSGDLLIYMEGGGACFNADTCGSVAHKSGWGPDQFAVNIGPYNVGIFDRGIARTLRSRVECEVATDREQPGRDVAGNPRRIFAASHT